MDSPTVIGEVKCSKIMYDELERMGANGVMYKTGHSNLKVKMRELNADLACEVSGHIFFKDRYFGFDDALYATLQSFRADRGGDTISIESLTPFQNYIHRGDKGLRLPSMRSLRLWTR